MKKYVLSGILLLLVLASAGVVVLGSAFARMTMPAATPDMFVARFLIGLFLIVSACHAVPVAIQLGQNDKSDNDFNDPLASLAVCTFAFGVIGLCCLIPKLI